MPIHWSCPGLDSPSEADARAAVESKMDAFWRSFADVADTIDASVHGRGETFNVVSWMDSALESVEPTLSWEFGPAQGEDGHRLCFSPETNRSLQPLIDHLIARAPQLPRWQFHASRVRSSWPDARTIVSGRAGYELKAPRLRIHEREDRKLDVELYDPTFEDRDLEQEHAPATAAYFAVENLLGEACTNAWIGYIDPVVATEDEGPWLEPDALAQHVDAHIQTVRASLADEPLAGFVERDQWLLCELPEDAVPPDPHRHGIFVARTLVPHIWTTIRSGHFDRARFTAGDEVFGVLKVERIAILHTDAPPTIAELEDLVLDALLPEGLGWVTGTAVGAHHLYIDVALRDPVAAMRSLREHLRLSLPQAGWLLFDDPRRAAEWVALHPGGPPPPASPRHD